MRAPSVELIRWGRERARTSPWRGDGKVALIAPSPEAPLLSAGFVRHCLRELSGQGFTRAVTGALSPLEQVAFLDAGFEVQADLRLLRIDLRPGLEAPAPGPRLQRVPRWRRPEVLAVDRAAFDDFWHFDSTALLDALGATPSVRFRRAVGPRRRTVAYAVSGRSGSRGFVQRLAVHPEAQRDGNGRRLLLDGLEWMRANGAVHAVVNTQTGNDAAVALYESVGFVEEPVGLSVLAADLK